MANTRDELTASSIPTSVRACREARNCLWGRQLLREHHEAGTLNQMVLRGSEAESLEGRGWPPFPCCIRRTSVLPWRFADNQHAALTQQARSTFSNEAWLTKGAGNHKVVPFAMARVVPQLLRLCCLRLYAAPKTKPQQCAIQLINPSSAEVHQEPFCIGPKTRKGQTRETATRAEVKRTIERFDGNRSQNRRKAGAMRQLFFEVSADGAQAVGALKRGHQVTLELRVHLFFFVARISGE